MREEQLIRHWRILRALGNRRQGVTVDELACELECAERTVYRDLAAIEAGGFPICAEKKDGKAHYRFVDGYKPGTSLEVTLDELLALYLSRGLLSVMDGTVFKKSIDQLLSKVLTKIPTSNLEHFENLSEAIAVGKAAPRDYGEKREIIQEIMKSLSESKVLKIRYYSASSGKESDREVDPYKLWYANDAFYLIGWCHVHDMVRTFLVDRIERAEVTSKKFIPSDSFDFSLYQDDAFRVIRDGKKEKVVILFDPEVAHSFREKKWHQSQQVEYLEDGSAQVTIEAEGLTEIRSWILSWGSLAEVLEPEYFRKEISEACSKMRSIYENGV